jgi:glycosyltransferase involved in cell wall biosynthesis
MAEEALKLGADKDRLHVIPNGVNRLQFLPRDKLECRRQLALPVQGKLLVTVAHLGHRKGHHEAIQALSGLADDVSLVIVGGAAQGGTAEELQSVARQSGVESRVILPGAQPYDRVPLYFAAADASVLASYREGCPNAVLESLACGTPVIATDVGAVPDILPVPAAGRIVPPQQIAPLRKAIAEVLDADWDAATVVRKSGVRSWDDVAVDVQTVMKKVLST